MQKFTKKQSEGKGEGFKTLSTPISHFPNSWFYSLKFYQKATEFNNIVFETCKYNSNRNVAYWWLTPSNKSVQCHLEKNSWKQLLRGKVFLPRSRRPPAGQGWGPFGTQGERRFEKRVQAHRSEAKCQTSGSPESCTIPYSQVRTFQDPEPIQPHTGILQLKCIKDQIGSPRRAPATRLFLLGNSPQNSKYPTKTFL